MARWYVIDQGRHRGESVPHVVAEAVGESREAAKDRRAYTTEVLVSPEEALTQPDWAAAVDAWHRHDDTAYERERLFWEVEMDAYDVLEDAAARERGLVVIRPAGEALEHLRRERPDLLNTFKQWVDPSDAERLVAEGLAEIVPGLD